MATDFEKKAHQLRIANMALVSLAASVWDMLGETAFAFALPMGETILHMLEKEMGLEVAGESPEDVMTELCRIFVDELGLASDIDVDHDAEKHFVLHVRDYEGRKLIRELRSEGVEKPFISPLMNTTAAALKRLGYKTHEDIEIWDEGNGMIITYSFI